SSHWTVPTHPTVPGLPAEPSSLPTYQHTLPAGGCWAGEPPVSCDSCQEAPAVQTCLTCTASFCAEHLRPHRDSPAFRDHQLCPPLRDLQQRKCPQHNRLFEFFCSQHGVCICSLCLLGHKTCPTSPLEQAKAAAQVSRRGKRSPPVPQRLSCSSAESILFTNCSFETSAYLLFLLQETASRKKELIRNEFSEIKALIEERENEIMKAITEEEKRVWNKFDYIYSVLGNKKKEVLSLKDQIEMALTESDDVLFLKVTRHLNVNPIPHSRMQNDKKLLWSSCSPETSSQIEMQGYAANITLDYNTAHSTVVLAENYTRMSISDTFTGHKYHPQRFTDYRQVLGFQCFKRGIHYWEVQLQQGSFCGIGVCYGSMERQGPDSRLGRNSKSWCIEWLNSKISSWHNDVEKSLPNTKATKIGVLLHCDGGFVIFTAVGEKHNLIYKFKAQFTEALYPAFWLFSSDFRGCIPVLRVSPHKAFPLYEVGYSLLVYLLLFRW
uniref:Tripartite motif containing 25 n=1 Tax=Cyanistes caeruleus TaxID=156563 RepID=A0A8C0ZG66_CYACU